MTDDTTTTSGASSEESSVTVEQRLEEVLDELSELSNDDEVLTEKQQGMVIAGKQTIGVVLDQVQGARYLNDYWGGDD